MPNITFAVDEGALSNAKAYASERSTTLNKLVNAYLKSLGQSQPRAILSKADEVLLDYSLGRKSLLDAAESLGLQDGGHVLALMRRAQLPMPQLSEAAVRHQHDENLSFFQAAKLKTPRKASRSKNPKRRR